MRKATDGPIPRDQAWFRAVRPVPDQDSKGELDPVHNEVTGHSLLLYQPNPAKRRQARGHNCQELQARPHRASEARPKGVPFLPRRAFTRTKCRSDIRSFGGRRQDTYHRPA